MTELNDDVLYCGTKRIATPERVPITLNFDSIPGLPPGETLVDWLRSEIALYPNKEPGPASALDEDATIDPVTSRKITQWIIGTDLTEKKFYRLDLVVVTSAGRRLAPYVLLDVAFY